MQSCGPQLFDAGELPQKTYKIFHVVPRLDFSCLHGGAAPREVRKSTAAQEQQEMAQVAAPAEASPEALSMPHTKPVEAAIACLGPLAMLPPKQPAMRREFTFVV